MNRETWLNELAKLMAPRFESLGFPLPKFRVSIGFTSMGANGGVNGQCWSDTCTDDKHFTIFISPSEATSMDIAAILHHELIHAAVGLKEGHKGNFEKVMKATGMKRPFTSSIPGDEFKAWTQPLIEKLGEIPHSQLKVRDGRRAKLFKKEVGGVQPVADADVRGVAGAGADAGEPANNLPPIQTTRMLKASCKADECGYTVRLSNKWAQSHGACCPLHGAMEVEGAGD